MAEANGGNRNVTLIAAALLALGIVIGGYLLGDGLRRARMADRAVTMRGLAERNVTADLATWSLNFSASGTEAGSVQAEIERDTRTIQEFFRAAGFPANAVSDGGGSINSYYDSNRESNIVTINRRLSFRTNDVRRAQRTYARQFDLIRRGVELQAGEVGIETELGAGGREAGVGGGAGPFGRRQAEEPLDGLCGVVAETFVNGRALQHVRPRRREPVEPLGARRQRHRPRRRIARQALTSSSRASMRSRARSRRPSPTRTTSSAPGR